MIKYRLIHIGKIAGVILLSFVSSSFIYAIASPGLFSTLFEPAQITALLIELFICKYFFMPNDITRPLWIFFASFLFIILMPFEYAFFSIPLLFIFARLFRAY